MKPGEFSFLADENFDPEVVEFIRGLGYSIVTASEESLLGRSDGDVLHAAFVQGRVVLTHDADFGALAIAAKRPLVGIIFVRPGHIRAEHTIDTLKTVLSFDLKPRPPFMLVAKRSGAEVTIRIRRLPNP